MRKTTPAQYEYLNALVQACENRGIELPEEVKDQVRNAPELSILEAGELIDDLKFELGWR